LKTNLLLFFLLLFLVVVRFVLGSSLGLLHLDITILVAVLLIRVLLFGFFVRLGLLGSSSSLSFGSGLLLLLRVFIGFLVRGFSLLGSGSLGLGGGLLLLLRGLFVR
jgi:hypothetical protein